MTDKNTNKNKSNKGIGWSIVGIGFFAVMIILTLALITPKPFELFKIISFELEPIFNKAAPDMQDAVEYNTAEGSFDIWTKSAVYQSEYNYGELYIDGRKIESQKEKLDGIWLDFDYREGTVPVNEVFDAVIVLYDDENRAAETVLIKGILNAEGNLDDVENKEDVKIFVSYKEIDIRDVIEFENIEELDVSSIVYNSDLKVLESLENLKTLAISYCDEIYSDSVNFANFENLTHLWISKCDNVDFNLSNLCRASNLEMIYIWNCPQVQGDIANLGSLEHIKVVEIGFCQDVHGDASIFEDMNGIEYVSLREYTNEYGEVSSYRLP